MMKRSDPEGLIKSKGNPKTRYRLQSIKPEDQTQGCPLGHDLLNDERNCSYLGWEHLGKPKTAWWKHWA